MRRAILAAGILAAFLGSASAQSLPNVNLIFEPFHKTAYKVGEPAGWTIHALLGAAYTKYSYEIRENNLKVLKSGVIDLSSGTGTLAVTLDHPGMVYARLSFIGAPAPATPPTPAELDKMTVGAAVAPEQIKAPRQAGRFRQLLGRQAGGAETGTDQCQAGADRQRQRDVDLFVP